MYTGRTWSCRARVHVYTSCTRPCYMPCTYTAGTRPCTGRVHGCAMYTWQVGMEVGLGHICASWGPSLQIFGPFALWPNGWMHQDASCYGGMEVGLGAGDFLLDGTQLPPPKGSGAPNFRSMFIVAKRLDGSRCHLVRSLRR